MNEAMHDHSRQPENPISGLYRLRNPLRRTTRRGRPYLRVQLEDMNGSLYGYLWKDELENGGLRDLSPVYIEGRLRRRSDGPVVDLDAIRQHRETDPAAVVRLIPQSICPVPWLMPVLQVAVGRITIAPLAKFVAAVLADDSLAFAFASAPASLNHHHNYPGGLLAHSLECFQMVERHHEFARAHYQIGLVAALFHDIGKILTLTHEMKRTSLGNCVDHDKLTLETLAPYLRELDRQWPQGATELRYLLTWKIGRRVPDFDMADLVSCCDRLSAGLDLSRRR